MEGHPGGPLARPSTPLRAQMPSGTARFPHGWDRRAVDLRLHPRYRAVASTAVVMWWSVFLFPLVRALGLALELPVCAAYGASRHRCNQWLAQLVERPSIDDLPLPAGSQTGRAIADAAAPALSTISNACLTTKSVSMMAVSLDYDNGQRGDPSLASPSPNSSPARRGLAAEGVVGDVYAAPPNAKGSAKDSNLCRLPDPDGALSPLGSQWLPPAAHAAEFGRQVGWCPGRPAPSARYMPAVSRLTALAM